MKNIVKYAGDRRLFAIADLKIQPGDRIGLVGRNGAGKSTLLAILAGAIKPDEGHIARHCPIAYIPQLAPASPDGRQPDPAVAGRVAVARQYAASMSGGEKARYKAAAAFSQDSPLLLADEPAASLDLKGREILQSKLRDFPGALVLVSHDRQLLDAVCTVIWEIERGEITVYRGNYTAHLAQKEIARKSQQQDYENYIRARNHLQSAIADRKTRSAATRKTPKRMGNSEARLHKMGNQKARANLDKAVKALEMRLEKLEIKEKPRDPVPVAFDFEAAADLHGKIVVSGEGIDKRFGTRAIFRNAAFSLANGHKAALLGDNGSGKSTLLNMIVNREQPLWVSPQARIGYFAQGAEDLDPGKTLLANVMAASVHEEGAVRNLLAHLLFRREDVYKPVGVLSGGERARVSIAKIIVGGANILLLDEPTNHLDLASLAALEEVLADYRGTLLFVSHDRSFIDKIATRLIIIDAAKLSSFPGNYSQYLESRREQARSAGRESQLVAETKLAELLSRLSVTKDKNEAARLDAEYRELLARKPQP
jgi:macrolide transport system ATP-binding/permease protein